jgi:hypothetical protein
MTKLEWGPGPEKVAYGDIPDRGGRITMHFYTSTEDGWTTAWMVTVAGKHKGHKPIFLGDYRSQDEAMRACEEYYDETLELCD